MWCRPAVATVLLVLAGAPLAAQQPDEREPERPRVERLRFAGARALAAGDLRAALVTEETRCRGLLLQPICWLTDWRLVHERHFLDRDELPRDELRLRVFYARRGYREAEVSVEVLPERRGVEVVFHIDEGEPTRIESLDVSQSRPVLSERQIRRAALPQPGEPLDLVRLDTALAHLAGRLGERGFLDALIHDTVEVVTAERRARVEVRIEPGPRSTVRELEIEGNRDVADRTISNAMMLGEGRVLRTRDIAAAQRSLYESNLFHEARVIVPAQPDSAKLLRIEVREAPPRSIRIGGGFNTLEFLQSEARFTHYNWLGGGRRLDIRGTVGNLGAEVLNGRGIFRDVLPPEGAPVDGSPFLRPTWLASFDVMQPAFRGAANTLGFSGFAHRRAIPAIVIDRGFGAEVSATRRLDYGVPATLAYRFERTSVEAGDLYFCVNYGICDLPTVNALQERHSMSPLRLGFFADRADDPIGPTTGYRLRLDLEHASDLTVSDFHYHRVSGEAVNYHAMDLNRRRVLAGRVRAGWVRPLGSTAEALGIEAGDQALLHPRKRFYSGGSRSVRGYAENQLGPRILTIDPETLRGREQTDGGVTYVCSPALPLTACDPNAPGIDDEAFLPRPLGGTSVVEGSVEYRFPLWRQFQGAAFADGAVVWGQQDDLRSATRGAVTPGFGIRIQTAIGPIRADLGIRPTVIERLPVVTEVVNGVGDRQLVRLAELRDYDPVAAAGGGIFRQVLARLQLHLAIGEAY
jgi:outer membrane protein insertion porin family